MLDSIYHFVCRHCGATSQRGFVDPHTVDNTCEACRHPMHLRKIIRTETHVIDDPVALDHLGERLRDLSSLFRKECECHDLESRSIARA